VLVEPLLERGLRDANRSSRPAQPNARYPSLPNPSIQGPLVNIELLRRLTDPEPAALLLINCRATHKRILSDVFGRSAPSGIEINVHVRESTSTRAARNSRRRGRHRLHAGERDGRHEPQPDHELLRHGRSRPDEGAADEDIRAGHPELLCCEKPRHHRPTRGAIRQASAALLCSARNVATVSSACSSVDT
jgi:hypothetical protein